MIVKQYPIHNISIVIPGLCTFRQTMGMT